MKKMHLCWSCIRAAMARIHLVDKFLIAFMVCLLLQSAYNLIANHKATGESGNIDVIVRTSTAAIFGYFLSTNFIHHAASGSSGSTGRPGKKTKSIPAAGSGIQDRIGFAPSDPAPSDSAPSMEALQPGEGEYRENQSSDEFIASRLQIITASMIGLFCLLVLILLRNVPVLNDNMLTSASAAATVAQFRDIVSGCIGFLIGCPTSGSNAL